MVVELELINIFGYEECLLVFIDYKIDLCFSIIDVLFIMVVNGIMVKIYVWYDNEWGYVNRIVELVRLVGFGDQEQV